jgi:hypothetical protein
VNFSLNDLSQELVRLKNEHTRLDDALSHLQTSPFSQLELQRIKKTKLAIKDRISMIESYLIPDSIA